MTAFPTPMLPEVSDARKARMCSPGARWVSFMVKVSLRESTMPSSDNTSCQSCPSREVSALRRGDVVSSAENCTSAVDPLTVCLRTSTSGGYCQPKRARSATRTFAPNWEDWTPRPTLPGAPRTCRPPGRGINRVVGLVDFVLEEVPFPLVRGFHVKGVNQLVAVGVIGLPGQGYGSLPGGGDCGVAPKPTDGEALTVIPPPICKLATPPPRLSARSRR